MSKPQLLLKTMRFSRLPRNLDNDSFVHIPSFQLLQIIHHLKLDGVATPRSSHEHASQVVRRPEGDFALTKAVNVSTTAWITNLMSHAWDLERADALTLQRQTRQTLASLAEEVSYSLHN